MKFITKINRNYLGLTLVLFVVITTMSYFIINKIVFKNAKENLAEKELLIKNKIAKTGELPNLYPLYETKKVNDSLKINSKYKQIYLMDKIENELEPYLEYATIVKVKQNTYLIKIRQPSVENEDLLLAIILPLLLLLFLAFLFSYLINRRQITSIWKIFEYNLDKIEQISLQNPAELKLTTTNIEEFESLNKVIRKLVKKLQTDYNNLKEFTENASHELQTPLTVILMSLEEVMQDKLPEETHKKVYQSYQEVKKLTKLNKNLLLLSKIDNQQFIAIEKIDLSQLIIEKLGLFKTLTSSKNITVSTNIKTHFNTKMNPYLANILINNILSNAINHNTESGSIFINIDSKSFIISNTYEGKSINLNNLFNRFYKENTNFNSVGLGLAIVKKIIDASRLKIKVHQEENKISFTLLN